MRSIVVNLRGCGFSEEKYKAIADKNVVVNIPIADPESLKGKKSV